MRSGSSTTAAATTGPASGPLPASSQPATGQTPCANSLRSRRKVGRSTGSFSGRRGAFLAERGIAADQRATEPACQRFVARRVESGEERGERGTAMSSAYLAGAAPPFLSVGQEGGGRSRPRLPPLLAARTHRAHI